MKAQIDILADYIVANVDGEPSRSEGAGDCAIRIITKLKAENDNMGDFLYEKDYAHEYDEWVIPYEEEKSDG